MSAARPRALIALAFCVHLAFAGSVFARLGGPLLWQDEAETAMFGRSVLEFGVPRVHVGRNVLYGAHHPLALGVHPSLDAYVASPWGQYYFAAPAVAWSDRARDLAERTWRMRLPFAAAGWLGILLLGAAGARLWPPEAGGRVRFWIGYGLCLLLSVSLQLHLREVRYYPLVVLGVAAVAWLELRRSERGDVGPAVHAVLLAPVLVALFNLFYPAYAAVTATAGCALALHAWRSARPAHERARSFARDAAPYLLAFAAVLPLAAFYGIPGQDRSFAEIYGPANPLHRRLAAAGFFLLRYEFAVPAALGAAALALALRRAGSAPSAVRAVAAACHLSLGLAAIWVVATARTPLFFERYLVPLSPVLAIAALLAIGGLLALRETGARRTAHAGIAAVAIALAGSAAARVPELRGRWTELREPYRGPLDHVIPYLAERYPNSSELVIATNYEDFSYMFYLRATAVLGFYAPDAERSDALVPDVIIPRPWPVHLRALEHLSQQQHYATREFPVANVRANNLPELSPRNPAGIAHRFRSPVPGQDGDALRIGERPQR